MTFLPSSFSGFCLCISTFLHFQDHRRVDGHSTKCGGNGPGHRVAPSLAVLLGLGLATTGSALATVIDDYTTIQTPVTLQAPADIGSTLGNSIAAPEAIGGRRDVAVTLLGGGAFSQVRAFVGGGLYSHSQDASVTATSLLSYDGDSDPFNVDPVGLGGVDITDAGTADAFEVRIEFADLGAVMQMEVYTDANNRSVHTLNITAGATQQVFIVPFSTFTQSGATGPADFANVGAITVFVDGSATTALDVQLDLLRTVSSLTATKTDAILVDNAPPGLDSGDTIEYTVVVDNLSGAAVNNVVYNDTVDPNTTLLCSGLDAPTTTIGSVTSCTPGTGSLAINVGTLAAGAMATITFRVTANTSLVGNPTQICNQGTVDSAGIMGLLTDDPDTFAIPNDPTCTPLNGKIIVVKQTVPANSSQAFVFTGALGAFPLTDGQSTMGNFAPGTYAVAETVPTGWVQTSATCDNNSPVSAITVAAGETVTCTFVNSQLGTINVVKNTLGGNGSFTFNSNTLTPSPFTIVTAGGTGMQSFANLVPGTFDVSEMVPASWTQTSATCDNSSSPGAISVAAGETVTCTFVNTLQGSIKVIKNTTGGNGSFTFTTTGAGFGGFSINTTAGTGMHTANGLLPGTFGVAETVPTGWTLNGVSCDQGVTNPANFTLGAGQTITCTFTNTKQSGITVIKNTVGGDGMFAFTSTNLPGNNFTITTMNNGGSKIFANLPPGTYDLAETVPIGWILTSSMCDNGSTLPNVTLAVGEAVTCTFTNTQQGTIIVEKQTLPNGAPDSFTFTGDAAGSLVGGGQIVVNNLDPGIYSSVETALAGWNLTGIVCDDTDSTGNTSSATATFQLQAGETVTCVFTNSKDGSITIVKQTDPAGSAQSFNFSGALGNFPLTDGQSKNMSLAPGTYAVSEMVPAGWTQTSATCTSGSPTAITVAPGAAVTCTFVNTLQGSIKVIKNTTGGDGLFSFTTTGTGFTGFSINTTAGSGMHTANGLLPGSFGVAETVPAGWTLNGVSCDQGVTNPANFTLGAGQTITCTFANTKQSGITVVKNTVGGNGTFAFTSAALGAFSIVTAGNTGSQNFPNLAPGTYDLAETVPTGWTLTSSMCDNGSTLPNVTLALGEAVICTFTNTQQGSIIVEKQTLPNAAPDSFTFTGDAAGSITDGGQIVVNNLVPGAYSSVETPLAGWNLSSIVCDDTDSTGNTGSATATFQLQAGETVTCVFTNSQQGSITVIKNTSGGNGAFDFTSNTLGPFTITTAGNTGSTSFTSLTPGNYDVAETVPAGWTLTSSTCDNGSNPSAIALPPNGSVSCTFNNLLVPVIPPTKVPTVSRTGLVILLMLFLLAGAYTTRRKMS